VDYGPFTFLPRGSAIAGKKKGGGTGVDVIGSIEFDEHHDRHDYGGLEYTNHFSKKRFIDYEHSDSSSSSSSSKDDDHY